MITPKIPTGDEFSKIALPESGFIYKTYDEIIAAGKLGELRDTNFTLYAVIYKNTFKMYPPLNGNTIDQTLAEQYQKAINLTRVQKLMLMSYDELMENDGMAELKKLDPNAYTAKSEEMDDTKNPPYMKYTWK